MNFNTIIGSVLSSFVILTMTGVYFGHTAVASIPTEPQVLFIEVAPIPAPTLYDSVSDENFTCLVHNIYFESRGESLLGQRAVAWVTINRVMDKEFPNTICDVVHQSGQFSWTHDGKSDKPRDTEALAQAKAMAQEVLENYFVLTDPTEGSLYFHAKSVRPGWRKSFNRVVQIDNHIFYNTNQG